MVRLPVQLICALQILFRSRILSFLWWKIVDGKYSMSFLLVWSLTLLLLVLISGLEIL